jgi:hypothetical protein
MKRSVLLPFFLILLAKALAQNCHCHDKLQFVIGEVEHNYSGFPDKLNEGTEKRYHFLKDSVQKAAKQTFNNGLCFLLIQQYMDFFKDNHTLIFYKRPAPNATADELRQFYTCDELITLDEVNRYLQTHKNRLSPVEGYWCTPNNSYRVAVFKKPNAIRDFVGVVVESSSRLWAPHMIKMEFKATRPNRFKGYVYGSNHIAGPGTLTLLPGKRALLVDNDSPWFKEDSRGGIQVDSALIPKFTGYASNVSSRFHFDSLSPLTNLIRIPDFARGNKPVIDSLVGTNWNRITAAPNLIIDLRVNTGGQDRAFDTLVSLAYTNEILQYDIEVRASEGNIRWYDSLGLTELADTLRRYKGGFARLEMSSLKKHRVYEQPRQIVVLVDRYVASTGEQFVLTMKQSGKVTIAGENTSGTLDYGMVSDKPIPGSAWMLRYATSKHSRVPEYAIDKIGITPDVFISPTEKDWIDSAKRLMEKRN